MHNAYHAFRLRLVVSAEGVRFIHLVQSGPHPVSKVFFSLAGVYISLSVYIVRLGHDIRHYHI